MYGDEVEGSRPRGRPKKTWKEVVREDCQARKLNKEDAMDRCKWRKVIKEACWSEWVWVGECFFWYRPTRVVPDQRPLNGRCCYRYLTYRPYPSMDFHAWWLKRHRLVQGCAFWGFVYIAPHLWGEIPKTPSLGVWIGIFKPNTQNI